MNENIREKIETLITTVKLMGWKIELIEMVEKEWWCIYKNIVTSNLVYTDSYDFQIYDNEKVDLTIRTWNDYKELEFKNIDDCIKEILKKIK